MDGSHQDKIGPVFKVCFYERQSPLKYFLDVHCPWFIFLSKLVATVQAQTSITIEECKWILKSGSEFSTNELMMCTAVMQTGRQHENKIYK